MYKNFPCFLQCEPLRKDPSRGGGVYHESIKIFLLCAFTQRVNVAPGLYRGRAPICIG